jgi:hypothetical protein
MDSVQFGVFPGYISARVMESKCRHGSRVPLKLTSLNSTNEYSPFTAWYYKAENIQPFTYSKLQGSNVLVIESVHVSTGENTLPF